MLDFTTRTPEILLWLGLIILVAAIVFYALAGSTEPRAALGSDPGWRITPTGVGPTR